MSLTNANTAASLQAQAPNFLPKLWKKGAELSEANHDFFMEFEGKGKLSPIRVETDFSKDAGQKVIFRTRAGLYGDGVTGDDLIQNDVEEWKVGDYELEVDYIRHATRRNQRTEDQTALRSEIDDSVNEELGEWLGRKKTKHLSMMLREKLHATSRIIARSDGTSLGSINDLRSSDTISMDGITSWGQQLKTMGGKAALVGKSGQNPILRYILVAVGESLVSLSNSSDYKLAAREGGIRGASNVIFSGGYVDVNGHIIREYQPIDHDGYGAIGSAMNPKALLGVEITADNEVQLIKGGGNPTAAALTKHKYFEFFSNYAYKFTPADILAGGNTERYCLIYNISGPNAHKMGFYAFTTNDGNKLTMTKRLRAAGDITGDNIAYTTIGGVTWDTGVWAGRHTDSHPEGSIIIETNSYGVPFGYSFMLGAGAALRGYGRFRNQRSVQSHEGGFVKDVFITSVFGQTPRKRTDNRTPSALCIAHAIKYAGLSIPNVT